MQQHNAPPTFLKALLRARLCRPKTRFMMLPCCFCDHHGRQDQKRGVWRDIHGRRGESPEYPVTWQRRCRGQARKRRQNPMSSTFDHHKPTKRGDTDAPAGGASDVKYMRPPFPIWLLLLYGNKALLGGEDGESPHHGEFSQVSRFLLACLSLSTSLFIHRKGEGAWIFVVVQRFRDHALLGVQSERKKRERKAAER